MDAACCGNVKNCLYTDERVARSEDEFKEAVANDHVFIQFKNKYRCEANFIRTTTLVVDCDNSEDWINKENVEQAFLGVSFVIYTSRNHLKIKGNKLARPRFHVIFFIDECLKAKEYKDLLERVQSYFPYFDTMALDAARFFYGNDNTEVFFEEGSMNLSQFFGEEDAFANLSEEIAEDNRNANMFNWAVRALKRYRNVAETRKRFCILYFVLYTLAPLVRLLICVYYFADILFLAAQQLCRGIGMNLYYSISAIVVSVINLGTLFVFVWEIHGGLMGGLFSLAVSYIISLAFLLLKLRLRLDLRIKYISKKCIKEMLAYSWPMVPNNLSMWILSLSDRLVITGMLGIEANAIYAVANKIPRLFTTAQSTFSLAWQENASEVSKEKNVAEYYTKVFDALFHFMSGIMAVIIAATPILFILLIRGNYDEAYYQMPMLFMGVFFYSMSAFFAGIYVAKKRTKSIGLTTIIAALINLAVDFMLVVPLGITAGSLSTAVSYLFLSLYRMFDIKKPLQ